MEGGKTQMCKGSQFSCKIQLLKNKGFPPPPFPFPLTKSKIPHNPSHRVHLGNGYMLI